MNDKIIVAKTTMQLTKMFNSVQSKGLDLLKDTHDIEIYKRLKEESVMLNNLLEHSLHILDYPDKVTSNNLVMSEMLELQKLSAALEKFLKVKDK